MLIDMHSIIFISLIILGEKLTKEEAKGLMKELCDPEDDEGFMPFMRKYLVVGKLLLVSIKQKTKYLLLQKLDISSKVIKLLTKLLLSSNFLLHIRNRSNIPYIVFIEMIFRNNIKFKLNGKWCP